MDISDFLNWPWSKTFDIVVDCVEHVKEQCLWALSQRKVKFLEIFTLIYGDNKSGN